MSPVLPDSAPFTAEQRAWLNGYLAGLFAWENPAPAPVLEASGPLTILFGSQTGGAEKAAKQLAKSAKGRGFTVTLRDMGDTRPADLAGAARLCVIASTYGDGEPPDRAKEFWKALSNGAPRLDGTRFSVLALGDSNYPKFCEFGRGLDLRLEQLGASRLAPRRECDGDWEEAFAEWSAAVLGGGAGDGPAAKEEETRAPLVVNRRLSGDGSVKDVRHYEFSLAGTGLRYACGDALSVWPRNDPALVEAVLAAGGFSGDEPVTRRKITMPLHEALLAHCDIARAPKLDGCDPAEWNGRDLLDLLREGGRRFEAGELAAVLKDLKPRLYSISSSPAAHGDHVHLTVSTVRWESHGRPRGGVCSTFLAERLGLNDGARVAVHENAAFRPPAGDVPLIMIGPGTGIAPFRGFLHERRVLGAIGRNWLFFGDQKGDTDYLYREEIEGFVQDGTLSRLDLAWSRDGAAKVYVQHRMLENAAALWEWLEDGAAVYVCGDAARMARDVDEALHQVIRQGGGKSAEAVESYVSELKRQRRYQRDVY